VVRHHHHHLLTLPLTEYEITIELCGLISLSTFNKRMQFAVSVKCNGIHSVTLTSYITSQAFIATFYIKKYRDYGIFLNKITG